MTEKKILLRLKDKSLYPKLEKMAKKQKWSVNTLIISVLEDRVLMDKKS